MVNPYARLLVDLVRGDVRFVTVGGVACTLNGYVRTTEDVDILVEASHENILRLLTVLLHFGEGHSRELSVEDFTDEEGAVRIIEDFPLYVFTRMGGRCYNDFKPYFARRPMGGVDVPYLDPRGLIILKETSHRERDQMDVLALKRILESG